MRRYKPSELTAIQVEGVAGPVFIPKNQVRLLDYEGVKKIIRVNSRAIDTFLNYWAPRSNRVVAILLFHVLEGRVHTFGFEMQSNVVNGYAPH